jgi:hypothetical protein
MATEEHRGCLTTWVRFDRDQLSQLGPIREGMRMCLFLGHLRECWMSKMTAAPFGECPFQLTLTARGEQNAGATSSLSHRSDFQFVLQKEMAL